MKYLKHIIVVLSLCLLFLTSCNPRIAFDEGQWGDKAYISDVLLFTIQQGDQQLQEYYENGVLTTGIRRIFLSGTSIVIDKIAATVVYSVPASTDLTKVGIVIRHTAKNIQALDSSPTPGYVSDFSHGPYNYTIISADGTNRVWKITIAIK